MPRRIRRTRGEALEIPISQPFRLVGTLSCGQGHRWLPRNEDGMRVWSIRNSSP